MNKEFAVSIKKVIIETYIVEAEDEESSRLLWNTGEGYMDNVEEIDIEFLSSEELKEGWL